MNSNPAFRLLKITLIAATLVVIPTLIFKSILQQKKYTAWDHPLFLAPTPFYIWQPPSLSDITGTGIGEFRQSALATLPEKTLGVWVSIALPPPDSQALTSPGAPLQQEHDKNELHKLLQQVAALAIQHSELLWFVDLQVNHPQIDEIISTELAVLNSQRNFVVISPYDGMVQAIKKKQPLWAFANSSRETTQMSLFEAFFILPLVNSPADIGIFDYHPSQNSQLKNICSEYQRRKKPCLLKIKSGGTSKFDNLFEISSGIILQSDKNQL